MMDLQKKKDYGYLLDNDQGVASFVEIFRP